MTGLEGTCSIGIGTLQIEFGGPTHNLMYVWGYHPRTLWTVGRLEPVEAKPGCLTVETDQEALPGSAISIAEVGEWLTIYDADSGWVSIGENSSEADRYVQFAEGQIAGLYDDQIKCLWVRPLLM